MPTRSYSGNAKPTTVVGAISAAATSITVADGTGYPDGSTGPFVITLDAGLAAEEKVLVATRTGNTFSVSSRGWDGTTASDHANAASVAHTYSATDAREANAHVNDTTGDPHPQYTTAAELTSALAGYLTTSGKAADSNLLDGLDSTAFLRAVSGTVFQSDSTSVATFSIRAAASQAANLQQWLDSGGVVRSWVTSDGREHQMDAVRVSNRVQLASTNTDLGSPGTGNGSLYVRDGALKYVSGSGTITTIVAGP